MATQDADDYSPAERPRSPLMGGAILIGVYVAMYLAAAGVRYILTAPDAMASVAASSATEETARPARADMPADAMRMPLPARVDNARECTQGATSDIKCAYL